MRQTGVMTGTPREDLTPIAQISPIAQKLSVWESSSHNE